MPKAPQGQPDPADQRPDAETVDRLDRALRRSLTMPSQASKKPKDSLKKRGAKTGAKLPPHVS